MPELAKHIEVVAETGKRSTLVIDGEEFPWYIAADGVATCVSKDGPPAITITILADRVSTRQSMA